MVLSIQFATLENLKSVHVGLLWQRFRSAYPDVSEKAPINAVFETFGAPAQSRPAVQFEQFLSPPMPRYWFEKSGTPDLLQLQQDRIIHNWRKREDDPTYPRYETLRDRFRTEVDQFVAWLSEEQIGEVRPNQCEVTYVNIIQTPGAEKLHDRLEQITPLWTGRLSEPLNADFDDAQVRMRFRLKTDEKAIGRVHVTFLPAVRQADLGEVIKLEITARGRPATESVNSAFDFFDIGRRAVVETFAAVTTLSMHNFWERTDGKR